MNRRSFLGNALVLGTGWSLFPSGSFARYGNRHYTIENKPALLGGQQAHPGAFPEWPVFDASESKRLNDVLESGKWGRLNGNVSRQFETEYAQLLGVRYSLAVSSGTGALTTMLGALDIGPGDEVILPVYTFIATYNVITLNYALPVFVDTDVETFQIDATKIAPAITAQTRLLLPVHIGGSLFDVDKVVDIGRAHNIPLIEDACQAHLAEWKGKKAGSFGLGGAFSFQSTKNLNCAEGGAIVTDDEDFIKKCYRFHNQGQGGSSTSFLPGEGSRATNLRLTEFQSALLLGQQTRLEQQCHKRSENASYLTHLLEEIPGITPAKWYKGATNSAYHLFMFRYEQEAFSGLSRRRFIEAMIAEGIPCSSGYGPMNKDAYVTGLANNRHYLKIYGERTMRQWLERNECPQNDRLTQQAVWLSQTMLLGSRKEMEQIAEAVRKIQRHAALLKEE